MTEQEKQQLVEAVITQLKNDGTDVSTAKIVEDVEDVAYILCYNSNGEIVRVEPTTINEQESELLKRIQGTSEKSDSRFDPFKDLGSFSSADEFNAVLDTLTYNRDIVGYGYGYFRATLAYRNIEIKNTLLSSGENVIIQVLSGVVRIVEGVITATGEKHNVLFRKHTATDGWSAWSESNLSDEDRTKLDKAQLVESVTWGEGHNLDNYTTEGVYSISGNRNSSDNMPILNSGVVSARLTVTRSYNGENLVIVQVLILNNNAGGEGNIYIRSNQNGTWKPWGKLQTNVEVGQITPDDMSNLIDNGIYSGVCVDGTTVETFVLIVINNYLAATQAGFGAYISQLKYSIDLNRGNTVKTRTRDAYGIWNEWVSLDEKSLVEAEKTRAEQAEQKLANKITTEAERAIQVEKAIESKALHYNTIHISTKADEVNIGGKSVDGTNTLSVDIPTATTESAGVMSAEDKKEQVKKTPLVNGDIIVGQAREVYSRQGKVDTATFLKRTTAGGTSVSDGVASVKQIGGNIVKNYVDASFIGNETLGVVNGHIYYFSTSLFNGQLHFAETSTGVYSGWKQHSIISKATSDSITIAIEGDNALNTLLIDLTEMFGAGKEPTKEDCDKMFGTMDALPQGLTIAQPTGLKSTGYNQFNPKNVLSNKAVTDNAVVDGDKSIAVVECLPCKTGAGENNGYVIGYGEGDDWSDEGVEVYLSPLNPLDVGNGAELYMHKLEKDSTYGTYVPLIKGCLLVVTPTTDKLCAHLHWSSDRAKTDYEEYVESYVALPAVPEMSEWGLAGISTSGTLVADTIDLDRMVYTKRVGCVDMGSLNYSYIEANNVFNLEPYTNKGLNFKGGGAILASTYTTASAGYVDSARPDKTIYAAYNKIQRIHIKDSSYTDVESFKASLQGVMLYYELAEPEEYPIVTKTAPNYIGSDYGVEEFVGSKIPLAANILFYMRSLVGETRNFLDRLMARLGTSDATAVADKIADAILPQDTPTEGTDVEPTEVTEV